MFKMIIKAGLDKKQTHDKSSKELVNNSVNLLNKVILNEYSYENERKSGIENRAGIALTLIGAISLFVIDKIQISEIINRMYIPFDFFDLIYVLSGLLFYLCFLISIILMLFVINTRKYKSFDCRYFGDEYLSDAEDVTAYFLATYYREILNDHKQRNDVKALQFTIGIISLIISIFMLVINLNL